MNKKTLLLTTILATLVLMGTVSIAYCSFAHSFPYDKFNTASPTVTYKTLDQNYTTWQIKITNQLIYNGTPSIGATIRINSTTTDYFLNVALGSTGIVDLWLYDGSLYKIGSGTWTKGEVVVLSYRNSELNMGNSTDSDAFVDSYCVSNFTACYVGAFGQENCTLSGYMTTEVASSFTDVSSMSDSVLQWMPLVIQFAMLSVVLGMLKKFGKI